MMPETRRNAGRCTTAARTLIAFAVLLTGCGPRGDAEPQETDAPDVAQDPTPSYETALRAAEEGDADALRWFRAAAEQGHADGQWLLGITYDSGDGVPQDYSEAVRWYRLAAEQGHASAQFRLGVMYDDGRGVPRDDAEAARWYRAAAEQGFAKAQNNLGGMYHHSRGVSLNYAEAMRWYRLAAEQGHAYSQYTLGRMYHKGHGVPRDKVLAHAWFNLAASSASDEQTRQVAVIGRDIMESLLTPEQIAEAQRRAREWTENHKQDDRGGGSSQG